MKKATFEQYLQLDKMRDFNDFHGTKFRDWHKFYEVVGIDFDMFDPTDDRDEDYKIYCQWYEIINTPLMKALSEEK
jgi:hypothetical protein